MGLTLVAILTAALLLPGIIAATAFFFAAQTKEIEASVPPLSTPNGIALVGGFSVLVHFMYVLALKTAVQLPPITNLPLANPYIFFGNAHQEFNTVNDAYALFLGLIGLCALAVALGYLIGVAALHREDKSVFYGPLAEIVAKGIGDNSFITAYVLTKMTNADRPIGYEGTVTSLIRDDDRYPSKVILKDASIFYMSFDTDTTSRIETGETIDWIALESDDWHNIAFQVFRVVNNEKSTRS